MPMCFSESRRTLGGNCTGLSWLRGHKSVLVTQEAPLRRQQALSVSHTCCKEASGGWKRNADDPTWQSLQWQLRSGELAQGSWQGNGFLMPGISTGPPTPHCQLRHQAGESGTPTPRNRTQSNPQACGLDTRASLSCPGEGGGGAELIR